jgi:NAD(P)-dependent dehydrogenase (short-subunit alcohol dehydrogenase family)
MRADLGAGRPAARERNATDALPKFRILTVRFPAVLTNLLLGRMLDSAPARIVVVASDSHGVVRGLKLGGLRPDAKYRTMEAYGRSKLANVLFVRELARRLGLTRVTVNATNPGPVDTDLGRHNPFWGPPLRAIIKPFAVPAAGRPSGVTSRTEIRRSTALETRKRLSASDRVLIPSDYRKV